MIGQFPERAKGDFIRYALQYSSLITVVVVDVDGLIFMGSWTDI